MKKSAALLGVLVLLIAAGCGGGGKKSSADTTTATTGGSNMKVGLVTDIGGLNDRGFNHLSFLGLQRAQSELGIEQRVYQAKSTQEYVPNLSTFARQGYDLTIGVGFTEATAIDTVATNFPQSKFAIVDVDQTEEPHKPANLLGLLFKEQETGYLVGYLAGLEAKKEGFDTISAVGANNVPAIVRYISGYIQGAKKADAGIKVLANYANDPTFSDQAKCKETALNQINQGSHVVFQVAGGCGLGALAAAKENKVWGIGVDADQRYLGSHIMTSALKRVDKAVEDLTTLASQGKLKTGSNDTFSLKNEGVGLGSVSPKIPKELVTKTNAIAKQIGDGTIVVKPTVKF